MKVTIWSDVVCPFCYIGKRRFESALAQFSGKERVQVEWKSFQLDPQSKPVEGQSVHAYLADRKGISVEEAKKMGSAVAAMAAEDGLQFHFDTAVMANTFDAHRLLQFAKEGGKGNEMKELLFQAYFTEGKNINARATLAALAERAGLDRQEALDVLAGDRYASAVQLDGLLAQQYGVRGVPFFVFNDQYAVSGAQPVAHFLQVLQRVDEAPTATAENSGAACTIDGQCD